MQKNGRCRTSEKRLLQSTFGSSVLGWSRNVDRHVPCQVNEDGDDSVKRALHSSSFLVKAWSALHVPPSLSRVAASSVSSSKAIISSGTVDSDPQAVLRLMPARYAFPEGRTPRGCRLLRVASSSVASGTSVGSSGRSSLTFFDGLEDVKASSWISSSAEGLIVQRIVSKKGQGGSD